MSSSDDCDGGWVVGFLLGLAFGGVLCGFIAYDGGYSTCRKDAIKADAAEWRIDSKTGEKRFEFITKDAE